LLEAEKRLSRIKRVVLVGSAKGGVGKSLVACGLAVRLAGDGYKVAVLDVDVHGATANDYLGVEPPVRSSKSGLEPKTGSGVKLMSVALFTGDNPVPLSGNQKQDVIVQLFAQTDWGALDFLVVDLPPGTGDELRSVLRLFSKKSAIILVTTPSPRSMRIVSRLRKLVTLEKVPLYGVVVNMAYLEGPRGRLFPFGEADSEMVAASLGTRVVAMVPLETRVNSERLQHLLNKRCQFATSFGRIAELVEKHRPVHGRE
jgi:ATP-binding protein involved in chromosome partitioning